MPTNCAECQSTDIKLIENSKGIALVQCADCGLKTDAFATTKLAWEGWEKLQVKVLNEQFTYEPFDYASAQIYEKIPVVLLKAGGYFSVPTIFYDDKKTHFDARKIQEKITVCLLSATPTLLPGHLYVAKNRTALDYAFLDILGREQKGTLPQSTLNMLSISSKSSVEILNRNRVMLLRTIEDKGKRIQKTWSGRIAFILYSDKEVEELSPDAKINLRLIRQTKKGADKYYSIPLILGCKELGIYKREAVIPHIFNTARHTLELDLTQLRENQEIS